MPAPGRLRVGPVPIGRRAGRVRRTELPPSRIASMIAAASSWSPAAPSASGTAPRWAAAASVRIALASASSMILLSVSESRIASQMESAASPRAPGLPLMCLSFRDRVAGPSAVAADVHRRKEVDHSRLGLSAYCSTSGCCAIMISCIKCNDCKIMMATALIIGRR